MLCCVGVGGVVFVVVYVVYYYIKIITILLCRNMIVLTTNQIEDCFDTEGTKRNIK